MLQSYLWHSCIHHVCSAAGCNALTASGADGPVDWVTNRDCACSQLRVGRLDAREVVDAREKLQARSPATLP